MHTYDNYGWYAGEDFPARTAPAPGNLSTTTTPGQLRANWTGYAWVDTPYVTPPAPTPPAPGPTDWFIDIGPFFDRFGAAKMAVLTSADAGVKAILQDVTIRKWIDLQRADVISSLAYIGSKVPSVDATLQTAILTTPVTVEENLALRKLYFQ